MQHRLVCAGAALLVLAAPAAAAEVQFYPLEKFTIVYKHTGSYSGTVTLHVRDFGRRYVEIKDVAIHAGGMTVPQKQRVIVNGPIVTTIDLQTNTATRITNPQYEKFANAMRGKSGPEVGKSFIKAMGGKETSETRSIARERCTVWKMASFNQVLCVTAEGMTLSLDTESGPIKMNQIATSVKRGYGGPDAAFEVGKIPVRQITMPKIPGKAKP
ncbi:MAG: hypothetical protein ACT4OG_00260 [Alphaproteobacteria bacterium]